MGKLIGFDPSPKGIANASLTFGRPPWPRAGPRAKPFAIVAGLRAELKLEESDYVFGMLVNWRFDKSTLKNLEDIKDGRSDRKLKSKWEKPHGAAIEGKVICRPSGGSCHWSMINLPNYENHATPQVRSNHGALPRLKLRRGP